MILTFFFSALLVKAMKFPVLPGSEMAKISELVSYVFVNFNDIFTIA